MACAASGFVAAAGTAFVASTLVARLDDGRLNDAAIVLAREIDDDDGTHSLEAILADENHEMQHTPFLFALVRDGVVVGDARVPPLHTPGCLTRGALRACAALTENGVAAIAGMPSTSVVWPLSLAGATAAVAAGFIAWFSSRRLGRTLEHEVASADRFAADASHELRTPLTTMRGELELAIEDPEPEVLVRVHRKVIALQDLVDQLLMLARSRIAPVSAALPVALDEVVEDYIRDSGTDVHFEAPEGVWSVNGDPQLIAALVSNAIGNALKFATHVAVQLSRDGADTLVLEVSDDGPGVPLPLRSKVFEPFVRGPNKGAGYGLGLAVIANVAVRYGGTAKFLDVPHGARLQIRLPRGK